MTTTKTIEIKLAALLLTIIKTNQSGSIAGQDYYWISVKPDSKSKIYGDYKNMINRIRTHKNYIGCTLSTEWMIYDNFYNWHTANHKAGLSIDKDLLVPGNKEYGPTTCVFLESRINTFLTNKKSSNRTGFIGVSVVKRNGKYRADVTNFDTGSIDYIGTFNTAPLASEAYKKAREENAKKCREYAKSKGHPSSLIANIK